jgi:hypothetical protein
MSVIPAIVLASGLTASPRVDREHDRAGRMHPAFHSSAFHDNELE